MLGLKKNALSLCLFGLALPIIGSVVSILFLKDWRFDHHSIHGIVEITGTIIAIVLFLFFYFNHKLQKHFTKNEILWISAAISGMGILDGFHAIAPLGNNFVWLHSIATFIGGILFAGVLLSAKNITALSKLPIAIIIGSIILGIMSFSFPEHIPPVVVKGEFTILARGLNILGGIGFVLATIYFYKKYSASKEVNYYFLAAHCLLFGAAGILFELSSLWDAAWWWWHILRLFAYVILIFFFVETVTKQIGSSSFAFSYIYIEKLLAASLIVISSTVILGWHTENKSFIQINLDFAPMQYNTALGFLLSGIGILALNLKNNPIRIFSAFVASLLGFATLCQYVFHINLGIDELLMDGYVNTKVSHPGRMAPNTALCFTITGLLILFYKNKIALLSLTSSLAILSGFACLGYIIEVEGLYGIGSLTRMAVHTATGFLVISSIFFLITRKNSRTQFDIWTVSPIICCTILSLATLLTWQTAKEFTIATNKSHFNKLVEDKISVIEGRFDLYDHALMGGKGLFNASKHVDRNEWRKYVEAVNPTKNLPGTNGIGYIDYVDEDDLAKYLKKTRANGVPDFKNHPKTDFKDKYIIKYIEPVNINGPAVGLDIGFEAHRREGAIRARDTGETSLTKIIFLVQDNKKLSGFLLLSPVYEKDKPIDTIEQRQKHFLGMVYSPFMGRNFMADIYEISDKSINFEVYDGEKIKKYSLIYKENRIKSTDEFNYLTSTTKTEFAGRIWTINWYPNINFKPKIDDNMPEIILITGILITALFSWLFYLLGKLYGDSAKQLETNRVKLDNIINNAVDGLILIDATGTVEMYNPACEKLFGYKEKEVLGKNIKMLMPEEYSKNHDQYIYSYIATRESKIIGTGREVEAKRKDGSIFPIDLSITDIKVGDRRLFSGVIRDITQKKEFEKSILKANKELETFTYIASHDLRSPLINLKGFTSKIAEHIEKLKPFLEKASGKFTKQEQDLIKELLEEKIPKAERFINDGVDRMDNMTSAILQLSRTGRRELVFKKINTQEIVDRCVSAISHQLGDGKAEVNKVPDIIGDETSIDQIFGNLLDNAVKYLDPQREGKLEVSFEENSTHYKLGIKDNGRGIAEDDQDKVFAIFRRAGNVVEDTKGEGMGLNHVKTLIERHGGEIWFESKLGKGTTFFFTIDKNLQLTTKETENE